MSESIGYNLRKFARKFTEFPLVEIKDKIINHKSTNKIPQNVYQTWETRLLGKTHAKSIQEFREKNPTFSFYLYDKEKRDSYMESSWGKEDISKIYFKSIFGPMKADIFRYCILYELGGYYFDIAKGCKCPLNQLHDSNHIGVLTYEDTICYYPPNDPKLFSLLRPFNHFLQWGLAFSSKNLFLESLINNICSDYKYYRDKVFENPKVAILNFTGPGMYTKVMRNYISNNDIFDMSELDIKFNNNGIFKLKGSSVRHYIVPSYTYQKNSKIVS